MFIEAGRGQSLRNELNNHLKHIRVCSMTEEDILLEVIPTKILTYDEIALVSKSRKTREVQPDLTTICNVIQERERPLEESEVLTLPLRGKEGRKENIMESTFNLEIKDTAIELCSLQLFACDPHQCNCTISIQGDTEPPIIVKFEGRLADSTEIPIRVNEENVRLSPNSWYSVKCTFSCSSTHIGLYRLSRPYTVTGIHFSVVFPRSSNGLRYYHFDNIKYKTLTKRFKSVQR